MDDQARGSTPKLDDTLPQSESESFSSLSEDEDMEGSHSEDSTSSSEDDEITSRPQQARTSAPVIEWDHSLSEDGRKKKTSQPLWDGKLKKKVDFGSYSFSKMGSSGMCCVYSVV